MVVSARGRRRSASCARTATQPPDVAAIKPGQVKIGVEDDILTVSGEHTESKEKDSSHLRRERRYGSVRRSMAPPAGVDAEQIEAKTHDGVVAVTIPLPSEAKQEPGHDHPDRLLTSLNTPGRPQPFDVAGPGAPRSSCSALTLGIPPWSVVSPNVCAR